MKITRIQVSSFLGARAADLTLSQPVTLFAGRNGAGKSSIQQAVRMALTGTPARGVDTKKAFGELVTEGADSGFAMVATGAGEEFSIALPKGKGAHSDNPALPFVLDAQRFAHIDAGARRVFLFGLMGVRTDGETVRKLLAEVGASEDKIALITPFLYSGFETAAKEAQARARDCKAFWKQVTGGETWGKDKAAVWRPEPLPAGAEQAESRAKDARAQADRLAAEIAHAQQDLGRAQEEERQRESMEKQRGALAELAGRLDRVEAKLSRDKSELVDWESKVEQAKAAAGTGRRTGLLHELAAALDDLIEEEQPLGIERANYVAAARVMDRYADEYGEIRPVRDPDPEAVASLTKYEAALSLMQSAVVNDQRDVAECRAAAERLAEIDKASKEAAPATDAKKLADHIAELQAQFKAAQADATEFAKLAELVNKHKDVEEQARGYHADVIGWLAIADELAPEGIPGRLLADAIGPMNAQLAKIAETAGWAKVEIGSDMAVTAGGRAYALLSESEQWRADAMIAAAVATLSGVKILVLDRFDVLDMNGRADLLYWLTDLAADGSIDSALVFGTLKAAPASLPNGVSAVWLERGVVPAVREAA